MSASLIDALEGYVKASLARAQGLQELPMRTWWSVSEQSGNRTGFHSSNRLDHARLARQIETHLRSSDAFEDVVYALGHDESLAGSSLLQPVRANSSGSSAPSPSQTHDSVAKIASDLVVLFLTDYLRTAGTHAFDEATFQEITSRLTNLTLAPGPTTRRLMPLAHMRILMDTFELAPGIVLRKVTAADIEHWVNHDWLEVIHKQPIAEPQLLVLDCLADITCHPATVGIIDAFQEEEDLCHRVVTALRLALDGDIQPAFWEGWRSGTLNVMQSAGVHPALRALSRPSPLDEQSGEVLKRIWDQLRTAPTATVAELAVRRWDDAAERRREDDRLVDYWVGLESLFSPDSNSEVRFRASYRIAAYLGNTGDERLEIYKFMRDSYDCRSAIVHGARSNKKLTEVPSYEERTRRYLRTAILKVLGAASFDPTVIERDLLAKNGATDEDSRI